MDMYRLDRYRARYTCVSFLDLGLCSVGTRNSCTPFRHGTWEMDTCNVDHKGEAQGVYACVCFLCTNEVQLTCIPWQQAINFP